MRRLSVSAPLLAVLLLAAAGQLPAQVASTAPPRNSASPAKGGQNPPAARPAPIASARKDIKLPLFFEANEGQADPRVRFLTRSKGYTLFLTPTGTVLVGSKTEVGGGRNTLTGSPDSKSAAGGVVRMQLVGANPAPSFTPLEELPGKVNYLIGNDPKSWHTGVSLYSKVRTNQVYPGIDLLFHGDQEQLEYDFVLSPGADPHQVALRITGAKRIELDAQGDLVLHTSDSEFRMHKPVVYQPEGTERHTVEGRFVLKGKNKVGFELLAYDRSKPLVIDPTISYATFLGGAGEDQGFALKVDTSIPGAPKVYVAGGTFDITTFKEPSSLIGTAGGQAYTFLAKIDPTVTGAASLDYLTFIGGHTGFSGAGSCSTFAIWISLDLSQGPFGVEPVLSGQTSCGDYPGTFIVGTSGTKGSAGDAVTRLTMNGAAIDASVVVIGNGMHGGGFSTVDSSGDVTLGGGTSSTDLPTTVGAYMTSFNNGNTGTNSGFSDCYITILQRSNLMPAYFSYLNIGAGSTSGAPVGCGGFEDSTGKILAGGNTFSTVAFKVGPGGANLANGFQTSLQGVEDTVAMVLDPTLSGTAELKYATYFGGGGVTEARNGALDLGNGVVAIVGDTTSNTTPGSANFPGIPLKNAFQSTNLAGNAQTGYLLVMDTTQTAANSLLCSTYFGGSGGKDQIHAVSYDAGFPGSFRIILGGQTTSADLPTMNPLQPTLAGIRDGFVAVMKVPLAGQVTPATLDFSSYIGGGVQITSGGSDRITGVGIDANHTIYATGRTPSADFFGHTTVPTVVNGFQTTCTSCGTATPADDAVVFTITTGPSATLQSITVTPANPTVTVGQTQQLRATGNYSDGSIQDLTNSAVWTTSSGSIATVSATGLAAAVGGGAATIKATVGAIFGTSTVTVPGAALASLAVTPLNPSAPAGGTLQFAATGTYSDSSKQDLTSFVTWASSNKAAATINATGLASAVTAGQSTTISATLGAISNSTTLTVTGASLVSILVTPVDDEVAIGSTVQYIATGLNSDGSTSDLTNSVAWSSSNSSVATVSASGLATGVAAVQTVTITAGLGSATGSTSLLVVPAAQNQAPNTILTVAGGGINGSNPTTAYFPKPFAAVRDAKGNTYISVPQLEIVYKVDAQGHMAPFAGRGTATGQFDFIGDGLQATQASLVRPRGLALDSNGNLFIADSAANRVRRVDAVTHIITTVAGSGKPFFNAGYTGDGGPATKATLSNPRGVAVDGGGNVFIADAFNSVVRRVDATTGVITTYAGSFAAGCSGVLADGGPATAASLCIPQDVSVDSAGNLFIADNNYSDVRKVDNTAQHTITTYAGNFNAPCGPVVDGGPASAASLCSPTGVFADTADNVYIADTGDARIRKVDNTATHIITTVAGNGTPCTSTATSCGDGGVATSAQLNNPTRVFLDSTGSLVITDSGTQRIRVVSPGATPTISNFAGGGNGGDNGPATSAVLGATLEVALDASGNYFATEGVRVRRVDAATQAITTYAGNGLQGVVGQPNGDGGPAVNASFVDPFGMALDAAGNVYVVDDVARVVRKIDNTASHTVTTIAGTGAKCTGPLLPGCGDGGPATAATFRHPFEVAVDSKGNLYISDDNLNRVRVVACGTGALGCVPPAGEVAGDIYGYAGNGTAGYMGDGGAATLAELNMPQGIGFDPQDGLYITDAANSVIRKVDGTTHNITTFAFNGQPSFGGDGGPALAASMNFPEALGLDSKGNLFIGGGPLNVVQRVDAQSQTVITLAGDVNNLDGGFTGDGGPATKALIGNFGVEVNASGVYIADLANNRIRKVKPAPVASVQGAFTTFAPTLQGTMSSPQVVAVLNTGLDDLVVSGVGSGIDPRFSFVNGCALPVPPGGTCVLSVTLAPAPGSTVGPFNSALNFSTNDPNNPAFSLPLSGTVVASGTGVTLTVALAGSPNGTGSVVSNPPGITCSNSISSCSANFPSGSVVTLVATPNQGSSFTGWTVTGAPAACPGTAPCTLTLTANQTVTATFDLPILTVTIIGNGTVTGGAGAINCSNTGGPQCTAKFAANTVVDLTPAANTGAVFVGWMGTACTSVNLKPQDCNVTVGGAQAVLGVTQVTAVFSPPAKAFTQGDVFLGSSGGMIFEYTPTGTLVQALSLNVAGAFLGGGNVGGMTFDPQGNLYGTDFTSTTGSVSILARNGTGPTLFRNGFAGSPNSVVLDTAGDVFVGLANGSRAVLEFGVGTSGAATATFFPAYEKGGANWITLLDDQRTMLYTSLGNDVKSFDVLVGSPYPDFAVNLPAPAFAVRELPDKTVLVAEGTNVLRLDTSGHVIQTYTPLPPAGLITTLYLDPDGSHFWAADSATGEVYEFNLLTGGVTAFSTGLIINPLAGTGGIGGIAVFGSAVAGGADLAISKTAASSIPLGSNLTYTIQVTNNGPLNATGVTLTDNLPGGLTGTNLSSGCSGTTTITCAIGSLPSGASTSVSITVTPTAKGTLINTATVAGTQPDPNLSNNSSTATTTVGAATLVSIAVTPANSSVAAGNSIQFTATGTFSDGSKQDLTNAVTWTSSDTTIATINAAGHASGVKIGGPVTIKAAQGAISGTTGLTVTAAVVVSIAVTPNPASVAAGLTIQFTATGTFSDGSQQNITTTANWVSSNTAVATISNTAGSQGLAKGVAAGQTTITASQSGVTSPGVTLTVTPAVLVSIAVTPNPASVVAGLTIQFTATGTFSDGTKQNLTATANWASSNTAAATISNAAGSQGLATGVAAGSTMITASQSGITSPGVTLTVTAPVLVSIAVTPIRASVTVGGTVQFTATGTFNNGTTQNLTTSVTWSSSNTAVATISNTSGSQGLATDLKAGGTTITATQGTISSTAILATPFAGPFQAGEVLVSDGNGLVEVFTPSGTSLGTLDTLQALSAGMAFDSTGNLYVTTFQTPAGVIKFDPTGKFLGAFGSGYTGNPESVLFNQAGDAFVGAAQNAPANPVPVFEFNASGNPITTFQVAPDQRGTDWIELLKDQKTLLYTSEGKLVKSFNISTSTQNPDFASALPGSFAFALRQLPDGSILVADTSVAVRLSGTNGSVLQTYTPNPAPQTLFALNLDPDGTSFWTADLFTGVIYKFDIATGNQLTSFTDSFAFASGVAIFGEKAPGTNNLTVTKAGSGTGTVTSNPAGINCGAVCVAPFTDNTSVTLTATVGTGSTFLGFSANCTPPSPQTNPPTCTVAIGTSDVTVMATFTSATLTSIAVTPANPSAAAGTTLQFKATGTFSDNSTQDITNTATWTSSNTAAATINFNGTPGLAKAVAAGQSTITAAQSGVSGSTLLTVTAATLSSIAVTPANPSTAAGTTLQFKATGTFSDGSTQDITSTATWTSSNTAAATINFNGTLGLAKAVAVGQSTITAAQSGVSGTTLLTVTAATLSSIAVTPANPSTAAGTTLQFKATGTFSDGSTQDITSTATWTSSNTAAATINFNGTLGLAKAVAVGQSTITASQSGVSGSTLLTVTAATLVSIAVTPPTASIAAGNTQPFTATGTFSDGTTQNITSTVVWTSSNTAIATINTSGVAKGVAAGGPITITAASGSINGTAQLTVTAAVLVSIAVTPANISVAAGNSVTYTATGTLSDGTTQNITNTVTWTSSDTTIATISAAGVATGVKAGGTVTIKAAQGTISGTAQLTVTAAILVSIAVTPTNPSAAVGQTVQFTATGTYSDKTTKDITASVTWASSNTNFATIAAGGLATAVAAGQTTISATLSASEVTGSTTLTVTTATFVFTPTSGTPSSVNITPGSTLDFGFTLTGLPGITQKIVLGCTTDKPQFMTCLVTPSSVTLSGNGSTQVAIVMSTFCKGNLPAFDPIPGGLGGGLAFLLAALALGSAAWTLRRHPRWALSFAVLTLAALGAVGCGGGPAAGPSGRTPPGLYTVTISATANGQTQSIPIQLNVLP